MKNIGDTIKKLRLNLKMSQECFAERLEVSRQAVQKWESNAAFPELEKLVKIAKLFDISLDSLVFESNTRITEELSFTKTLKPRYANFHEWESYSSNLITEFEQSTEEGLDLSEYEEVFRAVSKLPKSEAKEKLGDVLFDVVLNAKTIDAFKYEEPSDLEEIRALRAGTDSIKPFDEKLIEEKIHGAWLGRVCGCFLGKPVEGIKTDELIPFLRETNNYPMHRYILRSDLTEEIANKYKFRFLGKCYADECDGMPADDDTNYVVLAQETVEKYGRDFTPYDMSRAWLTYQGKDAYCTAERVAYCNFVKGFEPPESAINKNPYREWIGAQIRGDYFGYINPGNPAAAAKMAFCDACISHTKNGIYGEMFVAAMLAVAAVSDNIKEIIMGGLEQIPATSRLYEAIFEVLNDFERGVTQKECFGKIHRRFDEYSGHNWCHTISNAMIVAASLLYGGGSFERSICMAVEAGFDTDCNGATVGSVLGMMLGRNNIKSEWTKPINDTLHTTIFGLETVKISERVKKTLSHIKK